MSERPEVAPGTLVVYTDIACAWSTITLHRLRRARAQAGLDAELALDLRLYPLEEVNGFPLPERFLAAEIPVVGQLEQELGWQVWQGEPSAWPNTSMPANEAVHAAKAQSLRAAEQLDAALRQALFGDSRPIALRHEILDVAEGCPDVDVDALAEALDDGRARGPMLADSRRHRDAVQGSPHLFLADGSDVHHPDADFRWAGGGEGEGFPVVTRDEPQTCDAIVRRAAGAGRRP
jgi:predicted DsbA family dithiol-disulfide isomerase